MGLADAAGLLGVLAILAAYAATAMGRLNPQRAPALLANLIGALLILASLAENFNLSAAVMEASWALVALAGLIRLAVKRPPP